MWGGTPAPEEGAGEPLRRRAGRLGPGDGCPSGGAAESTAAPPQSRASAAPGSTALRRRRRRQVSGSGGGGGSLAVGAAVTSRAAAAALGGGEQLAPSARALLSLGPISCCHFSLSSPAGLARLQGAEVAAVTAPAGGCSRAGGQATRCRAPSLRRTPVALVSGVRASAEGARPRAGWGAGAPSRRRKGEPEVGAGAPRPRPASTVTLASPSASLSLVRPGTEKWGRPRHAFLCVQLSTAPLPSAAALAFLPLELGLPR